MSKKGGNAGREAVYFLLPSYKQPAFPKSSSVIM